MVATRSERSPCPTSTEQPASRCLRARPAHHARILNADRRTGTSMPSLDGGAAGVLSCPHYLSSPHSESRPTSTESLSVRHDGRPHPNPPTGAPELDADLDARSPPVLSCPLSATRISRVMPAASWSPIVQRRGTTRSPHRGRVARTRRTPGFGSCDRQPSRSSAPSAWLTTSRTSSVPGATSITSGEMSNQAYESISSTVTTCLPEPPVGRSSCDRDRQRPRTRPAPRQARSDDSG